MPQRFNNSTSLMVRSEMRFLLERFTLLLERLVFFLGFFEFICLLSSFLRLWPPAHSPLLPFAPRELAYAKLLNLLIKSSGIGIDVGHLGS